MTSDRMNALKGAAWKGKEGGWYGPGETRGEGGALPKKRPVCRSTPIIGLCPPLPHTGTGNFLLLRSHGVVGLGFQRQLNIFRVAESHMVELGFQSQFFPASLNTFRPAESHHDFQNIPLAKQSKQSD